MRALTARYHQRVLASRWVLTAACEDPGACPLCGGSMIVQKTVRRHAVTLEHGPFEVRETVHACQAGCRHSVGARVTRRAQILAELIPAGAVFGYDVMVYVGLERFVHHRQREEIRDSLNVKHGIAISAGEVSRLAGRFLTYLETLHEHRAGAFREALASDGGWPLHVDATGEDGRGTLLVAFAGWRQWVLGAWKIPTEREDAILPHLRAVVRRFGDPCAVMRDLGRAMIPAVNKLVVEMERPAQVLSCHLHFLRDVGTDILDAAHGELRARFRRSKVRPALRMLVRDLGRRFGVAIAQAREALINWQEEPSCGHCLPEGRDGLAVVRGVAQWVLDFQADSDYRTFPFDRPYLDLHTRCHRARRAADAFLRSPPQDRSVCRSLERLCRILDAIVTDERASELAATIRKRAALFDEFRDVLRLRPRSSTTSSRSRPTPSVEEVSVELRDIRRDLERWVATLRERRPQQGSAQDMRQAIDVVLDHIERHGSTLWGHIIALPADAGGGDRVVDRTNNIQESFFRTMKHGERRRCGRKILTQDFEHLPPQAALATNLTRPDYLAILCGSLDELPGAFAQLDADRRQIERSGRRHQAETEQPDAQPLASASLPTADRHIVRCEAMDRRVARAARSRAPRAECALG